MMIEHLDILTTEIEQLTAQIADARIAQQRAIDLCGGEAISAEIMALDDRLLALHRARREAISARQLVVALLEPETA